MQMPLPLTRDLVLVGGGHAHALVLRMWAMQPLAGVRLTVVHPGPTAPYSGMLPGHIAGHYPREALEIDLVRLARRAGARFVNGTVDAVDRAAGEVSIPGHTALRYDILSLNLGIHTEMPGIPGFADHAVAAKPLDGFANAWERWCEALGREEVAPEICVIGAGVAGVELALAMRHRTRLLGRPADVRLVESGRALSGLNEATRKLLLARLQREEITVEDGASIEEITADAVCLADGKHLPASFVVGAAGARAHGWLDAIDLETTDGFINVDETLRSVSDPSIFASGDCANLAFAPRPKAGVYAVRAAPVLFHNLRAALSGGRMRAFRPQSDYLKLISLGGKEAIADRNRIAVSGRWLWRWKDRIDRRFMQRFEDLPPMPAAPLPKSRAEGMEKVLGDKPLCGGCGAKVAGSGLNAALRQLPAPQRPDVLSRPGDDAAILALGETRQVFTTDHLRAFTEDPVLFARIAAVHALGDVWAMGAEPQAVLASVTLPPLAPPLQAQTLHEILDTATGVVRAAGADLVGGHTSIGAELSLGFSVTGLAEAAPVTLAGARSGDVLLLTKPIGSGTVLAGEMQSLARGVDVLATLEEMARPQMRAALVLSDARAMTDVTGFGLAGHLMGLCDASQVGAELFLDDIPLYPGALELASRGIRSTLYPANRDVAARMVLPEDARAELLFDPQTAGGLLAAVSAEAADKKLEALRAAGFDARLVGRIVEGPPFITVR